MSTVLVTGGSGFIGSFCILQLLSTGHHVRTTVRSLTREGDVRAMLKSGGVEPGDRLSFVAADLMGDEGWPEAVAGCDYVLHVASPFPMGVPQDENDLIVLTSSFAAVGYGHPPQTAPFDETNWTNPTGHVSAYVKSKTLAERAAWDFVASHHGLELSVVNPVGVLGPVLGSDYSTSIGLVQRLMDGALPGCPQLHFGVVDVRDVADLHIRAMTELRANGERFLAIAGDFLSMRDIAMVLKRRMGAAAKKVPTWQLPNWMVRLAALRDPGVKQILPELGKKKKPRSNEEAIVATAESLERLGLLKI